MAGRLRTFDLDFAERFLKMATGSAGSVTPVESIVNRRYNYVRVERL